MGSRNEEMLLARIKFGSIGGHADLFLSVCMTSNARTAVWRELSLRPRPKYRGPRPGVNLPAQRTASLSRIALGAERAVFALTVFFAAPHNVFGGARLAPCRDPSIPPQGQREQ